MSFFYSMLGVRHMSSVPPIGGATSVAVQVEAKPRRRNQVAKGRRKPDTTVTWVGMFQ